MIRAVSLLRVHRHYPILTTTRPRIPPDDAPANLQDPGQIDLAGHRREFARVHIGRQSPPRLLPPFQRTHQRR